MGVATVGACTLGNGSNWVDLQADPVVEFVNYFVLIDESHRKAGTVFVHAKMRSAARSRRYHGRR